jgi:Integrase core domain
MSGKGNCYDNAMVETVFKTIKNVLIWRTTFQTRVAAELALGRYIDGFYSPRRRHSALGYKSPASNGHHREKASPLNPGKSTFCNPDARTRPCSTGVNERLPRNKQRHLKRRLGAHQASTRLLTNAKVC